MRAPGEHVELELVGRDEIGRRQRALAHELRNARPHEHAAADIADHRIAAIARLRIRALDLADRLQDRGADLGRTDIARQHAVAGAEHAALLDAGHDLADHVGVEHAAFPAAVAGVVGELHGVDRPHLAAEPLQREHRRSVADVAVGDVRLDGEQIERCLRDRLSLPSSRAPGRRTCWCRSCSSRCWPWQPPPPTG